MTKMRSPKESSFERYWGVVKNGLLFFGLKNRLAKVGIDITPYYLVQEGAASCEPPKIKGQASDFKFRYLSIEEMKSVVYSSSEKEFEMHVKGMEKGRLCVALESKGEIAAYMFIELNGFEVFGESFELKPNEAYLLYMWTFHAYRGRNLAPYLRYLSYQLLDEMGRNVKYSITDYFNKSSIKFKKKLNAKHLYLYLGIALFKRYKWNFKLKKINKFELKMAPN